MRVTGVIVKNGKVLLMHRIRNKLEYWIFPGGGVEPGENVEDALEREILEETSLKLTLFEKRTSFKDEGGNKNPIFYCEIEDGKPRIHTQSPEHSDNSSTNWYHLEWVNITNALKLKNLYPVEGKKILRNLK